MLITLKQGQGKDSDDHGRVFYYWQESDLEAIFTELGFLVLNFSKQVSKVNARDVWLGFVLASENAIRDES